MFSTRNIDPFPNWSKTLILVLVLVKLYNMNQKDPILGSRLEGLQVLLYQNTYRFSLHCCECPIFVLCKYDTCCHCTCVSGIVLSALC